MRIGVDARMLGGVPTGLGTYAAGLVRALVRADRDHTYVIVRAAACEAPIVTAANVEEVVLPGELDTPRNLAHGAAISGLRLDLYHSLHHFLPLGLRVPRVVITLHDLIWIEHAGLIIDGWSGALHRMATHLFARAAMPYALRRADRIVAVSAHSRDRAVARYRLDASRIAVVHHGVDHEAYSCSPSDPSIAGGAPPYFLVLGNTRPYKNIPTALHAFASCARSHPDVQLVVVGRGDSAGSLAALARDLGIADRVRFLGLRRREKVVDLLRGAMALVFPSIVEGFGLPVLEAMACGCPVIAARIPTIEEVADGAGLLCPPGDRDGFGEAMGRVLTDTALRREMRTRGIARAACFSWERCAAETLAVYRQLLC